MPVQATADAMVSATVAGLGGAAFFTDGSCAWFQFRITLAEAQQMWPWVGPDMQKHIAVCELLAQFVLTFVISSHLPLRRPPIRCHQGCDNSAADAASAKGLTMTSGMSHVIAQYFLFMRRFHIYADISHTPGHLNVLADALSRFEDPPVHLDAATQVQADWRDLI